ncbi:hypothetical protein B5F29_01115 [Lachnoclostridium sp. An196]|nr:hypothetical protein B5F29_01115 [Lachnoclostridium sp. An196]
MNQVSTTLNDEHWLNLITQCRSSGLTCFCPHSLACRCSACMSLDCPVYCHQYTERERVPEHPP